MPKSINIIWVASDVPSLRYNESCAILLELLNAFSAKRVNIRCYILVYTKDSKPFSPPEIPHSIRLIYFSSAAYLVALIKTVDYAITLFDGYRLPDRICMSAINRSFSDKTHIIYIQHGRYTRLKRKLLNSHVILKAKCYLRFSLETLFSTPSSLAPIISKRPIFADTAFLYSPLEYWSSFHRIISGLTFSHSFQIPDRDFSRFSIEPPLDSFKTSSCSFLYVAQTLVEDGRCHKEEFLKFWLGLNVILGQMPSIHFDIRLHPRSSSLLWSELSNCTTKAIFNFVSSSIFPRYKFVLTHNSALATLFLENSIPVIFFDLSSEPLPEGLGNHQLAHTVSNLTRLSEIMHSLCVNQRFSSQADNALSHYPVSENRTSAEQEPSVVLLDTLKASILLSAAKHGF
jgi:hypothetical protein